ncbi:MAG TPA: hypothetical protein VNK23_01050, partial [Candidatus Dormibacteraeota bacterium]|nr:hypothetical protein [Candidatus Dormibacteraeota bacterium]
MKIRRLEDRRTALVLTLASLFSVLALLIFASPTAFAQRSSLRPKHFGLDSELQTLVETPSVSGYEGTLSKQISDEIAPHHIDVNNSSSQPIRQSPTAYHPVIDNLGDVIVTIGSGSPHRLLVAPVDEPGFVVSDITPDGYLRVQRLPQSGLPPIFSALYIAQPVQIQTASGKWINGVVTGTSIHLHTSDDPESYLSNLNNMYVDIGATSAADARAAGVDVLSPVVIDRQMIDMNDSGLAGASVGDKFGAAVLVTLLREINPAKVNGTLTVAFVAQQRTGARGLQRVLRTEHFDEMIYVGRLTPGGAIPGMKEVHRAPRQAPGSGVLVGLSQTNGTLSGFPAEL